MKKIWKYPFVFFLSRRNCHFCVWLFLFGLLLSFFSSFYTQKKNWNAIVPVFYWHQIRHLPGADKVLIALEDLSTAQNLLDLGVDAGRIVYLMEENLKDSLGYNLLYNRLENGKLIPPDQPPSGLGLRFSWELVLWKHSSPSKHFGLKNQWVHRVFERDQQKLNENRFKARIRRAFIERGVHWFWFSPFLKKNAKEEWLWWQKEVFASSNQKIELIDHQPLEKGKRILLYVFLVVFSWLLSPVFLIFVPLLYFHVLPLPVLAFFYLNFFALILYAKMRNSWFGFDQDHLSCFFLFPWVLFPWILAGICALRLFFLDQEFLLRLSLPWQIRVSLILVPFLVLCYEIWSHRHRITQKMIIFMLGVCITSGFFLLLRSMNQSFLPASMMEVEIRDWLETVLIARPRTREILSWCGISLLFFRSSFLLYLTGCLCVSSVCVFSMNTALHIHTPWWIVILREIYAFLFPVLIWGMVGLILLRFLPRKGILHLGYFGFGNLGDDLLAMAARRNHPDQPQCFIVQNESGYPDEKVLRKDIRGLVFQMCTKKTFSLGPGGIFQDRSSRLSCFYYLFFCWLARFFGMRVIWNGHGFSPLRTKEIGFFIFLTSWIVDSITVRDEDSYYRFRSIGVSLHKMKLVQDFVFGLPVADSLPKTVQRQLGIIPRSWNGVDWEKWVREFRSMNIKRVWFLFQREPGLEAMIRKEDPGSVILVFREDPCGFARLVMQSSHIVSMRFHGLVLGIMAKRKVFSLAYDQKCKTLAENFRLNCISESEFSDSGKIFFKLQGFIGES